MSGVAASLKKKMLSRPAVSPRRSSSLDASKILFRGSGFIISSTDSAKSSTSSSCVFFQAEDGIRDYKVTGVQTCALPIQAEDGIRDYKVTGVQTCALPI